MKVAVIGGGPAGSISARWCSKENDVVLYEEHPAPVVRCAGLVSVSGLNRIGIKPPEHTIKNIVYGARIFSPSGKSFIVHTKEPKAYVLDRSVFDMFLLKQAEDSGAIIKEERVEDIKKLKADKIILATGKDYSLHRVLGLQKPKKFLVGAQYELNVDSDPELVEVHFNVPDFFSWVIPAGEYVRVGCCSYSNPIHYLNRFIKKLSDEGRIKKAEIINTSYGIIPIYDPNMRTEYGKISLVGDAAAQVKASTGGGIVMGGLAASFTPYTDYERRWRSAIGRELLIHLSIHNFLAQLSEENKEAFLSLVAEHADALEIEGDMDLASKSVNTLLRRPSFSLNLLSKFPSLLYDVI